MKHRIGSRTLALLLAGLLLLGATACTTTPSTGDETTAGATAAVTDPATEAPTDEATTPVTDPATDETTEADTTPTEPTIKEITDMDELRDILSASAFAEDIRLSDSLAAVAGVTNPSALGLSRAELDSVTYPVPADSEFAHIYEAADYGITPDATDNAARLNKLFAELKGVDGLKKLHIPAGVYPIESTLAIADISDLYITGDGPDAPFELSMTNWVQGLRVDRCKNLHFNDFAFDYATPTAVSGEVVSSDTLTVTIRIDDEFDLTDPRYNGGKITWGSYMEYKEDKATGLWVPDPKGNLLYNSTGDQVKNITDGTYNAESRELTLTFRSLGKVKAGTRVSIAYTMYEYFGMYASGCEDIYVEGARFYHTAGMTFGADTTKNIYINRFRLYPREGSRRLMTATADCLHFGSCLGDVTVTNSVFAYSHDDTLNIKCPYQGVVNGEGNTVRYDRSSNVHPEIGDVIDIYERAKFRHIGSFTITAIDEGTGTYTVAETLPETLNSGYVLCNGSKSPRLTMQNCFIGNKRNRGLLIQCRGAEIIGCTFQNIVHGAIQILSVSDHFAEGIMPCDVTVKNCKFLGNAIEDVHVFTWGPQGTTAGTIKNVLVQNNYFNGTTTYPVDILGGGDITVTENLFDDITSRQSVIIRYGDSITVTKNTSYPKRKGNFATVDFDDTCTAITVTDNYIKDEPEA